MKTVIVYPIPFDAYATFLPFVDRFTQTFKAHAPGCDYEVHAVCNWGEPTDSVREMFRDIKTKFTPYYENGCDIGSAQLVAGEVWDDALLVCLTSRCYFHRPNWLAPLVEARRTHGAGLYGCSANHEGYRLHLCTRAYALDAHYMREHPFKVDTRAKGPMFEVGTNNPHGNLMEWMERNDNPARLVMFDGVYEKADWFKPANRFRHGDQSNMLVWDKHTDLYRDGSEAYQQEMARLNLPPLL